MDQSLHRPLDGGASAGDPALCLQRPRGGIGRRATRVSGLSSFDTQLDVIVTRDHESVHDQRFYN